MIYIGNRVLSLSNKKMKFAEKWMDLEHFLLIEVAQAKKVKFFLMYASKYGTMIHVINLRNQESETGRFL